MKVVVKSGTAGGFEDYILRVPAETIVFDEGDAGSEMYVIQSGSVDVLKRVHGGERLLATLEKGDFFGEMSILEEVPRTAMARTRSDCELVRIDQSTFDEMLRNNGEIAVRMLRKLSRRLRETTLLLERSTGVPRSPDESVDILSRVGERHEIYRLVPDAGGEDFYLNREGETMVGRIDPVTGIRPDVDLTNLDTHRSVSRRHARIVHSGSHFHVVEEIGTMNGTFVDGRRVQTGAPEPIRDGSRLRFGLVDLTFRYTDS